VAIVNDSIASQNANDGFGVVASAPTFAAMAVSRSIASFNSAFGTEADDPNALLTLAQTSIFLNHDAWGGTGVTHSYGDNYIDLNINVNGAPPSIPNK
jgi:hypothetical protein